MGSLKVRMSVSFAEITESASSASFANADRSVGPARVPKLPRTTTSLRRTAGEVEYTLRTPAPHWPPLPEKRAVRLAS